MNSWWVEVQPGHWERDGAKVLAWPDGITAHVGKRTVCFDQVEAAMRWCDHVLGGGAPDAELLGLAFSGWVRSHEDERARSVRARLERIVLDVASLAEVVR